MPKQTRRDFLRMLLGTAGVAAAGLVFNGCASMREVRFEKAPKRYDTIAHGFLDVETGLGVTDSDYQTLDDIIYEAQKRIEVKPEYTKKEAVNVLETIDGVLKDWGFEYQKNVLLNHGLKNKKIDCDNYSVIYLGIADVLKLPLKAVKAPQHVFVRWHFNESKYINWETTNAKERSDEKYKSGLNIPDVSVEKGVFLKSLSREETYSEAYNARGYALNELGKHEEAIESFDKALELNPNYSEAYNNKGYALHYLGIYEKAIENYDKAVELNPNHSIAYNNKGVALDKLEKIKE